MTPHGKTPTDMRGRIRALLMALALVAAATTSPLPALAETNGDTILCVERKDEGQQASDVTQQQQQSATVTSARPEAGTGSRTGSGSSPQTGDLTHSPVMIAAAGSCIAVTGAIIRKRKANQTPKTRGAHVRSAQAEAPCHGA